MNASKRKSATVRRCDKCGVLLSKDYFHTLCPKDFKNEYGYDPGRM